ncbi:putative glycerol uptake [Phaeomoniella chlamydospora]|uniref:Putative glycerol uptake n=1 Tax=Phaeomoniella chlamydospora TaxID=158046 RepID=A0A0G2DXS8_PHACM|nr:putative glycerol uptake [Phaeomoniella chlamydospora]
MAESNHIERLHTHDIELGVSDVLQKHITRHVVPPKPVSERKLRFEHSRPRILRECMAEATGVFFYVFPGIASVASFTLNIESSTGLPTTVFGSLFQIGWAFAIGIAFAIITCAPTSGGHFNPAITICFAIWQGFPWKKVPHYIFSQIFGAFIAGLLLMGMYWPEISALKQADIAAEGTAVFNGGAASILCVFPNANQTNQGFLFLQEFFVDSFIGIVIWACLDPANPFVSPTSAPLTIGMAYGVMVWGFAANTISTNLARDLGTRIVAAIFFGPRAFTASNGYAWISILVNIPATIFATAFYEFLMRDSLARISSGHAAHAEGEEGLVRHLSRVVGGGKGDARNGLDAWKSREKETERGYVNAAATTTGESMATKTNVASADGDARVRGFFSKE